MELIRHRIPLRERGAVVKLYPVSDTHLCSPEADESAVARTVALIKNDPDAYWGHGGDVSDCILPGDPRWNLRAIDLAKFRDERGGLVLGNLASWQIDQADEMFWPIAHKCLWLQEGNHEQAMYKHYSTHLIAELMKRWRARGVNVEYGGQTAFVRLDFTWNHEVWTKHVFTEHGATGGGSKGNSVNNFEQRLMDMDADIYFKGHVHKRMVWHSQQFSWGSKKITKRFRVMALTGAYLKSYGKKGNLPPYPERAGYRPETIGGVVSLIEPSTGFIDAMNIEAYALARR